MKRLLIIGLLCVSLSGCRQAGSNYESATLTEASPESVGMSSVRLAMIDSMCIKAVSDNKIPGVVALVARNGKIVFHKAFGMADNQDRRELKRDDIFRIASQTKAITATAVMILWEEGRFQLDDPISRYIPEFKNPQVLKSFNPLDSGFTAEPAKSEITIRQLLNHTSGIGYGMIDENEQFRMIYQKAGIIDAWTTDSVTIANNIRKLAKMPLHHNPGESYTYSEGLDVLGYFIEIISGMGFDEFLRQRIFEPLGMNDTWFYLPEDKAERLIKVQKWESHAWIPFTYDFYDPEYPVKGARCFFSGGAGLSSTALDYAKFLQMYLNNGEYNGHRILSPSTVRVILSNQVGSLWGDNPDTTFGLAFTLVTEKGQNKGGLGSVGTFSWGGYFNTQYFADPVEKTIGILMKQTQGAYADDTEWKFRILVSQAVTD